MSRFLVTREAIVDFLHTLQSNYPGAGKVYLIGETSQVLEGGRKWTDAIDLCAAVDDRARFHKSLTAAAREINVRVREEDPRDVIPLPQGRSGRERAVDPDSPLQIWHYDPYSVAFRFLARGDEPDYHMVLTYIQQGWIVVEEMTRLLDELMPQFSMETIQQDPAEFRRRYKGLLQMVAARQRGARTAQAEA